MKKNNKNKSIKLPIKFELAYEIIFISSFIILIGTAYLFASNLLAFNWFTVLFGILAIGFLYLKYQSHLLIKNDVLTIIYFKWIPKETIDMKTISEVVFYENSRIVEIKSSDQVLAQMYLTNKNKQKLMDFIVKQYSNLPCFYKKA